MGKKRKSKRRRKGRKRSAQSRAKPGAQQVSAPAVATSTPTPVTEAGNIPRDVAKDNDANVEGEIVEAKEIEARDDDAKDEGEIIEAKEIQARDDDAKDEGEIIEAKEIEARDDGARRKTKRKTKRKAEEVEVKGGGIQRGTAVALPFLGLLAGYLHLVSRSPYVAQLAPLEILAIVAVFAGVPALVAFGGLGRNLARRRKGASLVRHGSILGALVGLSLGLLAAVPLSSSDLAGGAWILIGGALLGALTGAALGFWTRSA